MQEDDGGGTRRRQSPARGGSRLAGWGPRTASGYSWLLPSREGDDTCPSGMKLSRRAGWGGQRGYSLVDANFGKLYSRLAGYTPLFMQIVWLPKAARLPFCSKFFFCLCCRGFLRVSPGCRRPPASQCVEKEGEKKRKKRKKNNHLQPPYSRVLSSRL